MGSIHILFLVSRFLVSFQPLVFNCCHMLYLENMVSQITIPAVKKQKERKKQTSDLLRIFGLGRMLCDLQDALREVLLH